VIKIKSTLLLFSFLLIASFTKASEINDSIKTISKDGKQYIQYKVSSGNTFYSLSSKYDATIDDIKSVNQITELKLNDTILIPLKSYSTHTVVAGESLYSISKSTGVDIEQIKKLNHLVDNNITLGQVLNISPETKKRTIREFQNIHVVSAHETLYSISIQHKVSPEDIKELNELKNNDLTIGQKLIIPSKVSKAVEVKILQSQSNLLDNSFCEVLVPKGKIGNIIFIHTNYQQGFYARIVGFSTDENLYGSKEVFNRLNTNNFSAIIKINFQ
jgi:LysM repeat protein